jgi:hypothetical protein
MSGPDTPDSRFYWRRKSARIFVRQYEEAQEALDILLTELEESDINLGTGPSDDDSPSVLDTEQAGRFLELYGRLLVYADRISGIEPIFPQPTDFSSQE